jgi:hypothetical protein
MQRTGWIVPSFEHYQYLRELRTKQRDAAFAKEKRIKEWKEQKRLLEEHQQPPEQEQQAASTLGPAEVAVASQSTAVSSLTQETKGSQATEAAAAATTTTTPIAEQLSDSALKSPVEMLFTETKDDSSCAATPQSSQVATTPTHTNNDEMDKPSPVTEESSPSPTVPRSTWKSRDHANNTCRASRKEDAEAMAFPTLGVNDYGAKEMASKTSTTHRHDCCPRPSSTSTSTSTTPVSTGTLPSPDPTAEDSPIAKRPLFQNKRRIKKRKFQQTTLFSK